jgi:GT2 family glycosyltransferase
MSAPVRPVVSVLIVNYNGAAFIDALLDTLGRAFDRHASEVIVVDNASTDGSRERLRERGDIRLVLLADNLGFAAGNNIAASQARGSVLLLLNNDARVDSPLDALVDAALEMDVGAVGCRVHYGDGRLQHTIGLAHTPLRIALSWLGWERRAGLPDVFRKFETDSRRYAVPHADVAWVSGACLATRADVWRRVDGFDPDLFMYCEDVDYCRRVRAAGWRVGYRPEPVVVHLEAGGKAWPGAFALLRTCRSYYVLITKTAGRGRARALSLWLGALFGARSLAFGAIATLQAAPRVALCRDKSAGYGRASRAMFAAAWRGQVPALP